MSASPDLIVGALVTLVGGGGLWAYLGTRGKTKADLITIAQDAASDVIGDLREQMRLMRADRREDRKRITDLERQDERCQRELADLRRKVEAR